MRISFEDISHPELTLQHPSFEPLVNSRQYVVEYFFRNNRSVNFLLFFITSAEGNSSIKSMLASYN